MPPRSLFPHKAYGIAAIRFNYMSRVRFYECFLCFHLCKLHNHFRKRNFHCKIRHKKKLRNLPKFIQLEEYRARVQPSILRVIFFQYQISVYQSTLQAILNFFLKKRLFHHLPDSRYFLEHQLSDLSSLKISFFFPYCF